MTALRFVKDLTMASVGIVNVVFGAVIAISPLIPIIRLYGVTFVVGGVVLILVARD